MSAFYGSDYDDAGNVVELRAEPPRDDMWEGSDASPVLEHGAADNEQPGVHRSWRPVDLTAVLDGSYVAPQPAVGHRDDGVGVLYLGRVHSSASEPEGGKTWLLQQCVLRELDAGKSAIVMDFEDDEGGFVGRLLTLGAKPAHIRDRFAYLRPDTPIGGLGNREDLDQALGDLRPTLVGIDGVTEAMSVHGLELKDNSDVAKFDRLLARRIADSGPAVLKLDHVTKDRETRGRFAIGGQHKLAGLNGAAFILENRMPFEIGITGCSGVFIAKDRPGQLRRHALPSGSGLHWFADLTVDSNSFGFTEVTLTAPVARTESFRPTVLMGRVSDVLVKAPEPLSLRGILDRVKGRDADKRTAVAALIDDGYIALDNGPRGAHLHRLIKPFGETE